MSDMMLMKKKYMFIELLLPRTMMKLIVKIIIMVVCFFVVALGNISFDKIGSWSLARCYSVSFDSISSHNYAVVGTDSSVVIINVDNPITPIKVSEINCGGKVSKVVCNNNIVCALFDSTRLRLIDITIPNAPILTSHIDSISLPIDKIIDKLNFAIMNKYLLVVNQQKLFMFNIENLSLPKMVWNAFTDGHVPNDITVQGDYAYLAFSYYQEIRVLDLTNPSNPVFVADNGLGVSYPWYYPTTIYAKNGYAFLLFDQNWNTNPQIGMFDISNPNNPADLGTENFLGSWGLNPNIIALVDSFAFVTARGIGTIQAAYINFHDSFTRNHWWLEGSFPLDTTIEDFAIYNKQIYVANGNKGLIILAFSETTNARNQTQQPVSNNLKKPWIHLTAHNSIQYYVPFNSHITLSLVNSKGQYPTFLFAGDLLAGIYFLKINKQISHNFNFVKMTINKKQICISFNFAKTMKKDDNF